MSDFTGPDQVTALVFGQAARVGHFRVADIAGALRLPVETVERVRRELLDLNLLQPSAHNPELLIPIHPDVAATELTSPAESEIRHLSQQISDVRLRLSRLTPAYSEGRREFTRPHRGFHPIEATGQIKWILKEQISQCRSEILLSGHGTPVPEDVLWIVREKLRDAARRGIRIRALCRHASLVDPSSHISTAELAALGVTVRSRPELAGQLAVFDRELAVVFPDAASDGDTGGTADSGASPGTGATPEADAPESGAPDGTASGGSPAPSHEFAAVTVSEPTTLRVLCAGFDQMWQDATPFGGRAGGSATITGDLKVAIVRLLAQGNKDEVVARRLGLSVRQCRRHVKEIMNELDAESRFQAGAKVALGGALTLAQTASDVA